MRKKVIIIVTSVFFVLSTALVTFLYQSIKKENDQKIYITQVEEQVISKLGQIRKAEVAYFSINNEYTDDWEELKKFLKDGKFYLTNRTEEIISRPYGGDSIIVSYDTLSAILVKDSLFKDDISLDINTIDQLPHASGSSFGIFSAIYDEGAVIEVVDSKPVNPDRQDGGILTPLKFGSQSSPTTKGSWEK